MSRSAAGGHSESGATIGDSVVAFRLARQGEAPSLWSRTIDRPGGRFWTKAIVLGLCDRAGGGRDMALAAAREIAPGRRLRRGLMAGANREQGWPYATSVSEVGTVLVRGGGRTINRARSKRCSAATNLTAKPFGKGLITRPMQAPIASGIPTGGCSSDETAAPEVDMSMTKHGCVVPSASVMVECGLCGMMRASLRKSGMAGSFCFISQPGDGWCGEALAHRRGHLRFEQEAAAPVSLIRPSNVPKSRK